MRKTEILDNRTRGRKSTGTNDGSEDEDETTKPVKKSQEKPATKTKTSGKSPSEDKMEKSVKKPAGDEKEKAIKEKAAPKPSKMPKLDDDRMEPAKKDDPKSSSSSSAKSTKTTKSVKSSKPKDYNDEEPPMKRADPLLTSPKPPKPTSSHPPSSSAFKSPHRSASSETPRSKISSSLPAKAKPASDLPLNASAERVRQEYETLKLQYTTLQRHYDELRHVGITKANESFDKYKTETMKQTAGSSNRLSIRRIQADGIDSCSFGKEDHVVDAGSRQREGSTQEANRGIR